ncbi:hypothetical protein LGK95_21460 [Clostridium algoriphilum]|uniref:hypothetical protein n=1 Tax=Clostridium algoriphilum TaxID=198347 RepID=UPI001CF57433|nr:hypothetical protein [Clostridium algoriphilum]MCB2296022.1 hypothetical protein [Clostridium algoriphilum]
MASNTRGLKLLLILFIFIYDGGLSLTAVKESGTNDLVMCDIYSIKFVRVFDNQSDKCRG